MPHFPEEFVEKVREGNDLVSVIGDYIPLKKAGANYKALCPFHSENTPSFSISSQKQIFKCFGCGKAGNVFHFLMYIDGVSFPEAVTSLAERAGLSLPDNSYSKSYENQRSVLDLLTWSAVFFQRSLKSKIGNDAKEYLRSRNLQSETIDKFLLGYAPNSWDTLTKEALAEGFSKETLLEAGLATEKNGKVYDRFRNRVIFPIWNPQKKIVAFGGRVLSADDNPKYLNSPETSLFSKKQTLYALHLARSSVSEVQDFLIMEGYTDVLMAHQNGFGSAVATLGTALTPEHTKLMKRYSQSATIVFDGDVAGVQAATRSLAHFLSQGMMVKVAILPDKLDPCDLIEKRGYECFAEVIANAEDFFDFQIRSLQQQHNLRGIGSSRHAIDEINTLIAQIPDSVTQQLFISKIADTFSIPKEILNNELKGKQQRNAFAIKQSQKTQQPNNAWLNYRNKLHQDEEKFILGVVLDDPHRAKEIFESYLPEYFQDPKLGKFAQFIADYVMSANNNINIEVLSSQLPPEESQELISIYFDQANANEEEKSKRDERLELILRGIVRKKSKARFLKLKKMLHGASSDDTELKGQILVDARDVYKSRLRRNDN